MIWRNVLRDSLNREPTDAELEEFLLSYGDEEAARFRSGELPREEALAMLYAARENAAEMFSETVVGVHESPRRQFSPSSSSRRPSGSPTFRK